MGAEGDLSGAEDAWIALDREIAGLTAALTDKTSQQTG
jgi:hypothetical protein